MEEIEMCITKGCALMKECARHTEKPYLHISVSIFVFHDFDGGCYCHDFKKSEVPK